MKRRNGRDKIKLVMDEIKRAKNETRNSKLPDFSLPVTV